MLEGIINKYFTTVSQKETNWFASQGSDIIQFELKAARNDISYIKTYYNQTIRACIYKMKLNRQTILDVEPGFLYFLLSIKENDFYKGAVFEQSLLDNGTNIKWISENRLWVFKRENAIQERILKILK